MNTKTYLLALTCPNPHAQSHAAGLVRAALVTGLGSHTAAAASLNVRVADMPELMKRAYEPTVAQESTQYDWALAALKSTTPLKHHAKVWVEQILSLHPHDIHMQRSRIGGDEGRRKLMKAVPDDRWHTWSVRRSAECACAACEHIRSAVRLLPRKSSDVMTIFRDWVSGRDRTET